MSSMNSPLATGHDAKIAAAMQQVTKAVAAGDLSNSAEHNVLRWLTKPRYRAYRDLILKHIDEKRWQTLDDIFWTVIPFGTGGRRGRMYEIGSNAINDETIGESAQGLANYITKEQGIRENLSCAIAYDTRHRSRHFAELCAGIMVAAGFHVYLLDDYRATPQLSFTVRRKNCTCGIMVTASHNPPSDNAVKVYWSTGGQILPPHDAAIIDQVMSCESVERVDFETAVAEGKVEVCTAEIDKTYLEAAVKCAFPGPRDLKILYTPLHGVGAYATVPLLKQDGFQSVEVYQPHAQPNGDFPNVPGHVSNPENRVIFDKPIEHAQANGFDLVLATDPDADRLGCAAPLSTDSSGPWGTFTGNQIAAVLTDYILTQRSTAGTLSPDHYVVKTLVTTELLRRIATHHGVRCEGNLLVGFKWIAGLIDQEGADKFVFGAEESHGYLIGQYARDKDGPVACMILCELVAWLKQSGQSLHEYLDGLYRRHGYHQEHLVNLVMEGSEGMAAMKRLMAAFRTNPPSTLGGQSVSQIRDYLNAHTVVVGSASEQAGQRKTEPLEGPQGDLVILDFADQGNYVAVRPSGTEPKVKFYLFASLPANESKDLEGARRILADRIEAMTNDVRAFADQQ